MRKQKSNGVSCLGLGTFGLGSQGALLLEPQSNERHPQAADTTHTTHKRQEMDQLSIALFQLHCIVSLPEVFDLISTSSRHIKSLCLDRTENCASSASAIASLRDR